MRNLKLAFGICLMVVFLISCKTIETNVAKVDMPETIYHEGRLNIVEVMQTWEPGEYMSSIGGMPMIGFINPDKQQDIQYVIVALYQNMPVAYAYLLRGEPYIYYLNEDVGFELLPDTDKKQWKLNFKDMFGLTEI